jgi:hypothetical protein
LSSNPDNVVALALNTEIQRVNVAGNNPEIASSSLSIHNAPASKDAVSG